MPVKFKNAVVNDKALPSNIENVVKFYHSFAGIHDMEFDATFEMSLSGWTNDAGLTTVIQPFVPLFDDEVSRFNNLVLFQ